MVTRSTFQELMKRKDQRFDYVLVADSVPDFTQMEMGSKQTVRLRNLATGEIEQIAFCVAHNQLFPTGQRAIYGLVETTDGTTVQIEFNIYQKHIEFNNILAFLRAKPFRRLSPSM